jgi:hypothetical protein
LQRENGHTAQLLRSGWTQAGRQFGYNAGLLIFLKNVHLLSQGADPPPPPMRSKGR